MSEDAGWLDDYGDVVGGVRRYAELEAGARGIYSYQSDLIPGLLQTAGYAHAVAESYRPDLDERQRARFVEFRMARKRVLDRVRLHVVISEHALWRQLGSAEVMAEQLDALAAGLRHGRPNVTVQLTAAARPSFVIMRFADAESDLVYLEGEREGDACYLAMREAVSHYDSEFARLVSSALGGDDSLALVEFACMRWRLAAAAGK